MFRRSLIIALCLIPFILQAQPLTIPEKYPTSDFRFPLDLSHLISGTFGEIRSAHLHSGMDIRTNQSQGHPVFAVADGYVSRLRVQFGGFGNAVYINHPNGYTSVYAHLQRFSPRIAKAVKDYQYSQQLNDVDFPLLPINIPVRKGDIIAWSGNTGGSAGPHLHFEIRDTKTEETINPQLFGIEIPDKVKPIIAGIYLYHLNGQAFSEKTKKEYFPATGSAGNYSINTPTVNLNGESGFGISTYDQTLPGGNHNGIYSIELKIDQQTIYFSVIERFRFDHSQAANSYMDFPAYMNTGRMIQKSFVEPGNPLTIYKKLINNGILSYSDQNLHDAQYIVKDINGNTSTLNFKIKGSAAVNSPKIEPEGTIRFSYSKTNEFSRGNFKISVPAGALYSDLDFDYSVSPKTSGYSEVHHVHTRQIPVHDDYSLWIKPDQSLSVDLYNKAVIVDTRGRSFGSDYEDGYVKAMVGTFGNFYISIDVTAPAIRPVNISDGKSMKGISRAIFKISDNLSGIKSIRATIDGKWVLMEYDPKSATLWHTFDERTGTGKHDLKLEVSDKKLNTKIFTATFYR